MTIENIIKKDIQTFFNERNEVFFNEKELQIQLSVYLTQSGNYDDVNVEYYIPFSQLDGYIWKNELYLDIVVRKGDEYVAIELKYPTKKIAQPIVRFGEKLPDVSLLKEHSAINLIQYNFWKDVRRLELLKKRFPSVRSGLSVLLTNDLSYMKPHKKGSDCEPFSTNGGMHNAMKCWSNNKGDKMAQKGYPDFVLDKQYAIDWNNTNLGGNEFIYCIVEV